ncbi:efflux RND transporter periplasmic adaptor subunit [Xylophilus sp. GOD-11R]|nr:efflux RND transporter periplasmic adaptor subunit [Xylophilus sp. GOD-11R]WPB59199.1 efflux RND transporter periplasmic adaptor subunit [Xylophilus sp. GOD-11R]
MLLMALAGCEKQAAAPPPQPTEVGVITVATSSVPVFSNLPGRTSAYQVAQVRARVDGIVLSRDFTEGSNVKAGQRLYKIDPQPYIATLNAAKATLARAQANLVAQNAQVDRYKVLVAGNAVSKQNYDNALATQGQAAADVASGQAAVRTAEINLGYTDVKSPISGRIGLSEVTPGAYVQASGATLLATVQQLDPMYVDLTQSSVDGLQLRTDMQEGRLQTTGANAAKVQLTLENGREYADTGKLQFSDVSVDQGTGSVTVRAVFPNRNNVLLPGMFVRARLEQGVNNQAMLIPQVGVTHDQSGRPVALVIGAEDKVEQRVITTTGTRGADWIVTGGLKVGDRVIVQGTEKARPGTKVKAVEAKLPEPAKASDPNSPAAGAATPKTGS